MNKTIWKFPLELKPACEIRMPVGANILSVQMQAGLPTLWASVNPEDDEATRYFALIATGQNISEGIIRKYIGTVQMNEGLLVFHVFELTQSST